MDYTKQELRPLIYQDRSSIDEFDVADFLQDQFLNLLKTNGR